MLRRRSFLHRPLFRRKFPFQERPWLEWAVRALAVEDLELEPRLNLISHELGDERIIAFPQITLLLVPTQQPLVCIFRREFARDDFVRVPRSLHVPSLGARHNRPFHRNKQIFL